MVKLAKKAQTSFIMKKLIKWILIGVAGLVVGYFITRVLTGVLP